MLKFCVTKNDQGNLDICVSFVSGFLQKAEQVFAVKQAVGSSQAVSRLGERFPEDEPVFSALGALMAMGRVCSFQAFPCWNNTLGWHYCFELQLIKNVP